jgi:hypothetical protein
VATMNEAIIPLRVIKPAEVSLALDLAGSR